MRLQMLTGLEGIASVGGDHFIIRHNYALCEDNAIDLESRLLVNGNDFVSTIEENNGECL